MRLRFLARFWRADRPQSPRHGGFALPLAGGLAAELPPSAPCEATSPTPVSNGGRHRRGEAGRPAREDGRRSGAASSASPGGGARPGAAPGPGGARAADGGGPARPASSRHRPLTPGGGGGAANRPAGERAAVRVRSRANSAARNGSPGAGAEEARAGAPRAGADRPSGAARLPWYEVAHARRVAQGMTDCGPLEAVLVREWLSDSAPPPESAHAVMRLADLPESVKRRLADGIDAIHVGAGGVPDLDDMGRLRGVPLPSGRATWDACAGAYGERKIIVGTRPSAAPDVMCHEVGHALDDIDGLDGGWQSDEDDFRTLYERCLGKLVSDFHRQAGALGRREFFADSFAAIASSQRPALLDMLGGDTRSALQVMLYFNLRYGI